MVIVKNKTKQAVTSFVEDVEKGNSHILLVGALNCAAWKRGMEIPQKVISIGMHA